MFLSRLVINQLLQGYILMLKGLKPTHLDVGRMLKVTIHTLLEHIHLRRGILHELRVKLPMPRGMAQEHREYILMPRAI
jgi:hypothetical protein